MNDTTYYVQLGKNKSSYKTRWTFHDDCFHKAENRAILYYRGLNVGYGYKKRLVKEDKDGRHVIARQFSA